MVGDTVKKYLIRHVGDSRLVLTCDKYHRWHASILVREVGSAFESEKIAVHTGSLEEVLEELDMFCTAMIRHEEAQPGFKEWEANIRKTVL